MEKEYESVGTERIRLGALETGGKAGPGAGAERSARTHKRGLPELSGQAALRWTLQSRFALSYHSRSRCGRRSCRDGTERHAISCGGQGCNSLRDAVAGWTA